MKEWVYKLNALCLAHRDLETVAQAIGCERRTIDQWRAGVDPSEDNQHAIAREYERLRQWAQVGLAATMAAVQTCDAILEAGSPHAMKAQAERCKRLLTEKYVSKLV